MASSASAAPILTSLPLLPPWPSQSFHACDAATLRNICEHFRFEAVGRYCVESLRALSFVVFGDSLYTRFGLLLLGNH